MTRFPASLAALIALSVACSAQTDDDPLDGENDPFPAGKADGGIDEDSPEALAVLALVNDPEVDFEELDDDARLNRISARNIIDHRDGDDELPSTDDDDLYGSLQELDDIRHVGPAALKRLLEYAIAEGYLDDVLGGAADVVFSPKPLAESHNARVAEMIDDAEHSLDIAMYSFSDSNISKALANAVGRGVAVRFVFETANADRKLEGDALQKSKSGKLENAGVNVRWVNKIMHHKYMIVDGPRDDLSRAATAPVVTGSANWSFGGASIYDENTLFMTGHEELTLELQREFNLMWEHSRDVVVDPNLPFELSTLEITDELVTAAENPNIEVYMTSDNFDVSGTTFRINHGNTVSDALVEAIEGASQSIWIASGHLRSRPVSEALMAKATANPDMDIRVYLDGQEFISEATHEIQLEKLEQCLVDAGTSESKKRKCMDKGFRFGFAVGESGADVRYKHYAYRWHFSYAKQMHHKYMVVDGDELWSGSYNLSDNAEHNTFENMYKFDGGEFAALVAAYQTNFLAIWDTGTDDELAELIEEVETADEIPIVYTPMALTWDEVTQLKGVIRDNCTQINTEEFRKHPEDHKVCPRDG